MQFRNDQDTFRHTENALRDIVNVFESAKQRGDLDALAMAEIDAQELGVPFYKIMQIANHRNRVPILKSKNLVPAFVVASVMNDFYNKWGMTSA